MRSYESSDWSKKVPRDTQSETLRLLDEIGSEPECANILQKVAQLEARWNSPSAETRDIEGIVLHRIYGIAPRVALKNWRAAMILVSMIRDTDMQQTVEDECHTSRFEHAFIHVAEDPEPLVQLAFQMPAHYRCEKRAHTDME